MPIFGAACSLAITVSFCFLWFSEGSTGSGSGFKASQKTGPQLKVSPDSLGEARIEPATQVSFCGRVPWLYQYWSGGFMLFVVLCPGTPEGSTS